LSAKSSKRDPLKKKVEELEKTALKIRQWVIKMIYEAGSGHPGGSLSATDILTVLYFHEMKFRPKQPGWEDRDRMVLSKGHAAPAQYAAMSLAGFFPEKELLSLRKLGTKLQGHPSMTRLPGIDISTGSLGQGLSCAIGMALAGKLDKKKYRVHVICGDGEIQEGQIWEAAMSASHYDLDNLVAFVDMNRLQIDGCCQDVMCIDPVAAKFKSFGWYTQEIDGHDLRQIINALQRAKKIKGQPTAIIAKTTKGKGVSFMEDNVGFHGKAPNKDEFKRAMKELGVRH
jgi:transketolase